MTENSAPDGPNWPVTLNERIRRWKAGAVFKRAIPWTPPNLIFFAPALDDEFRFLCRTKYFVRNRVLSWASDEYDSPWSVAFDNCLLSLRDQGNFQCWT